MVQGGALSQGAMGAEAIQLLPRDFFSVEETPMSNPPVVAEEGGMLHAVFENGVRLDFERETIVVTVRNPQGTVIARNMPGAICGLTYLPEGLGPEVKPVQGEATFSFSKVFLLGESLILTFDVTSADGEVSHLDWAFTPVRFTSFGTACVGLSDQIMIVDPHHKIHKIHMHWLGPVETEYEGSRSFRFGCYPGGDREAYKDVTFGGEKKTQYDWGAFIDGGQFFHLIGLPGGKGSIFEHLDHPVNERTGLTSNGTNDAVLTWHNMTLGRSAATVTAPARLRFWIDQPLSANLWIAAYRHLREAYSREFDIPLSRPAPLACKRNAWRRMGFRGYAEQVLPGIVELGYRRVEIGWIWRRGWANGSEEDYPVLREWADGAVQPGRHGQTDINGVMTRSGGGVDGLRHLVRRAHEMGLEVFVWHQTAHGWRGSPVVREHPEWLVHGYDGHSVGGWNNRHLPVLYFSLNSGWKDYTLDRLRELREETEVDGLWLDVYAAGAFCSYDRPHSAPTMMERLDYTRSLREMGYQIYSEGISTTCVDSFVMYAKDKAFYKEHPHILYGTCPYRSSGMVGPDDVDLFALMCYECFPYDRANLWEPGEDGFSAEQTGLREEARYRNKVFNEISDQLGGLIGLQETDHGTQWLCEKGHALFFLKKASVTIRSDHPFAVISRLSPEGDRKVGSAPGPHKELDVSAGERDVILLKRVPQ